MGRLCCVFNNSCGFAQTVDVVDVAERGKRSPCDFPSVLTILCKGLLLSERKSSFCSAVQLPNHAVIALLRMLSIAPL